MDEEYTFRIDAKPQVKQRPRMSRRGKVYTPAKTRDYEQLVASFYHGPKFEGPVALYVVLADNYSIVTIKSVEKPDYYLRGDVTNYIKAIEDGLNGVAYNDDRQIRTVGARKV